MPEKKEDKNYASAPKIAIFVHVEFLNQTFYEKSKEY